MKKGGYEQTQDRVIAFHELLRLVKEKEECPRSEQYALAFIIEDMVQKKLKKWMNDYTPFKEGLIQEKETGGLPAITWKLAQEFHDRYDELLARLERQEQDPIRLKNIEMIRRMDIRDMEIRLNAFNAGRRVPIGSVILEHVPKWIPIA